VVLSAGVFGALPKVPPMKNSTAVRFVPAVPGSKTKNRSFRPPMTLQTVSFTGKTKG